MAELRPETHEALVRALLELPIVATEEGRLQLVLGCPQALRDAISLAGPPRTVLDLLIDTAARWQPAADAEPPLVRLIINAAELVPGTTLAERLTELLLVVQNELGQAAVLPPGMTPPGWVPIFTELTQAFDSGDYTRALELAQRLPGDYPGLAPLVQRATVAQLAVKKAADALVAAWADHRWREVLRLAAEPQLPGHLQPLIEQARRLVQSQPDLPQPSWWKSPPAVVTLVATGVIASLILLVLAATWGNTAAPGLFPGNLLAAIIGGGVLLGAGLVLLLSLSRLRRGDVSVPMQPGLRRVTESPGQYNDGPHHGAVVAADAPVASLLGLLAGVPALADRANRDALLVGLPPALATAVPRAADPPGDLDTMVRFLDDWGALDDGQPAVGVLIAQAGRQAPPPVAALLRERFATTQAHGAQPVDHSARFHLLTQAYARDDRRATAALATMLPPDYPGLAPLLARVQTASS